MFTLSALPTRTEEKYLIERLRRSVPRLQEARWPLFPESQAKMTKIFDSMAKALRFRKRT
jgi:hypothetical protein